MIRPANPGTHADAVPEGAEESITSPRLSGFEAASGPVLESR